MTIMSQQALFAQSHSDRAEQTPNVIVIFIDDLGYADIGAFGAVGYETPFLDQMAADGMVFTDFVTSTAVCSASRAALLTGCYHRRVGISGALGPQSRNGLAASEVTIAEMCKTKGYRTACYGKWHLGTASPDFMPLQQGFDEYYGLPYSNDMWPLHPDTVEFPEGTARRKRNHPPLPIYEGNEIVDAEVTAEDQTQLTTDYTLRAVDFIDRFADENFFLYVPHSMVHVPLYVSEKFAGKSDAGMFGDVMMEVDWSVGQIVEAVRRNGIEDNTLIVFTSDNGPWLSYGDRAGSAAPLREGKGTMWEGGYRVPTIMQWAGQIPAGSRCDELCSTIDLFPTIAEMIGGELPAHRIDGHNILPLMHAREGAVSPHEAYYCYYKGGQLQAVRDRQWKLVFEHQYRSLNGREGGTGGSPVNYEQLTAELALYDLKSDVGETTNVADANPEVVERLQRHAATAREELGDKLTGQTGSGIRPSGRVTNDHDN